MIATDHGERIAVLESQLSAIQADFDELKVGQQAILTELTKYKGAVGAATFILSCLIATLTLTKDWILAHWK